MYIRAENLCSVEACCRLFFIHVPYMHACHLLFHINVPYKLVQLLSMEKRMAPPTSVDGAGAIKEPLSAAEAVADVLCMGNRKPNFPKTIRVITSRTRATKVQLELQLDSEREGRQ